MKTQKEEVVKLGRPAKIINFPKNKFTVNNLFSIIQRSNKKIGRVQISNRCHAALVNGEIKVIAIKPLPRGRPERIFMRTDPSEQKSLASKARRAETIRIKGKNVNKQAEMAVA